MLEVPLSVLTHSPDHKPVKEETTTLVVNAHGGLLKLRAEVSVGEALLLLNPATGKQEAARVVRVERPHPEYFAVAFEFNQPAPKFWPITFPPPDWQLPPG
jgi:hypothetical protein